MTDNNDRGRAKAIETLARMEKVLGAETVRPIRAYLAACGQTMTELYAQLEPYLLGDDDKEFEACEVHRPDGACIGVSIGKPVPLAGEIGQRQRRATHYKNSGDDSPNDRVGYVE